MKSYGQWSERDFLLEEWKTAFCDDDTQTQILHLGKKSCQLLGKPLILTDGLTKIDQRKKEDKTILWILGRKPKFCFESY